MAEIKRNYQPGKITPAATSTKSASIPIITKKTVVVKQPLSSLFTKENYRWMGIGAGVIILGMLLMMGGKNQNPNVFDYNVVYSTMRITVAPIVILAGIMIEVYAIFKTPKTTVPANEL